PPSPPWGRMRTRPTTPSRPSSTPGSSWTGPGPDPPPRPPERPLNEERPMPTTTRRYEPTDEDRVVDLSLAAWAPVFASFRTVLGDDLYERVHPDWEVHQAAAVRAALAGNDTWVAVTDGLVSGFVNVTFDTAERSGEIYMIAVDPHVQRQG